MVEFLENGYVIKITSNTPAEDYANVMRALLEYMKNAEKDMEEERYWIGKLLQDMQLNDSQVRKVIDKEEEH